MNDCPEDDWIETIRRSTRKSLRKLRMAEEVAVESRLIEADAQALGEAVKRAVAEHY